MKYFKTIVIAIFIGITLSFIFLLDIKKEVSALDKKEIVYAFQIGVFHEYENAINYQTNYPNSIIYYDQLYYRIFVGVTNNNEVKEKLINYYNDNNIKFFIKEYTFNETIKELNSYNEILINTNSKKVIDKINYDMLKIFSLYLQKYGK